MNHRHLLPDEIDLLLDNEVGFGVAPLKAHVRECDQCRARVDDERRVLASLEASPHFAPSHTFADAIMSQVPVFVPWHVTARDTLARWLPQSKPARLAVGVLATSAASILTAAILWVATQTDVLAFASGAASDELRSLLMSGARALLAIVFGDQVSVMIQAMGSTAVGVALAGLGLVAAGSIAGLRALALASSRRRV
jgi:hypothetical protein